jgi:Uma2 family endonuclease
MATIARKLVTAEEFAQMPDPVDGSKQELVRGEIVTMTPPNFRHGLYQGRVLAILDQYVRNHRLGRVVVETGIITEHDPDTVRPDVSYWSAETLPLDQIPEGYPDVPADLCVEIITEHTKNPDHPSEDPRVFRSGRQDGVDCRCGAANCNSLPNTGSRSHSARIRNALGRRRHSRI